MPRLSRVEFKTVNDFQLDLISMVKPQIFETAMTATMARRAKHECAAYVLPPHHDR